MPLPETTAAGQVQLCYLQRCAHHLQDAVAYFKVSLGTKVLYYLPMKGMNAQILDKVWLMDDVCASLGMPEGGVFRIAEVVCKVWKETLMKYRKEPNV